MLLAEQYSIDEADLAATVYELTLGWPALTHLLGAALSSGARPRAAELAATGTAVQACPPGTAGLLATAAEVGSLSPELAATTGHQDTAALLALLARVGLFVPAAPSGDWHRPVPLVAEVARLVAPLSQTQRAVIVVVAAEWHTGHGRPVDALRLAVASGDHLRCAHLLNRHQEALLASGAGRRRGRRGTPAASRAAATADEDAARRLLAGDRRRRSGHGHLRRPREL